MRVVWIDAGGTLAELEWTSGQPLNNFFDASSFTKTPCSLTFVGAIDELNIVAVAARYDGDDGQDRGDGAAAAPESDHEINVFCEMHPSVFDVGVRGDVLLVGSDENGEECDVSLLDVARFFECARQNSASTAPPYRA